MKITVEHCDTPENEVILRCRELDDKMLHVLALLRSGMQTLCAFTENREAVFLSPQEVMYAESVEERTWLYCEGAVWRTALTLAELESRYESLGFCRVSRSMVVNLHGIRQLKSCAGSRIEAIMRNGEKVMISRHYGPLLRERLGM